MAKKRYGFWCSLKYYGPQITVALGLEPKLKRAVKNARTLHHMLHPELDKRAIRYSDLYVYRRDRGQSKTTPVQFVGHVRPIGALYKLLSTKPLSVK